MKNKELSLEKRAKIAQIIKRERENKGLSFEELADKVGIGVKTLQKVEEGKFSPDSDLLCLILKESDCDMKINEEII